jgi:uncharacterized membrane protein YhhN
MQFVVDVIVLGLLFGAIGDHLMIYPQNFFGLLFGGLAFVLEHICNMKALFPLKGIVNKTRWVLFGGIGLCLICVIYYPIISGLKGDILMIGGLFVYFLILWSTVVVFSCCQPEEAACKFAPPCSCFYPAS